MDDMGGDAVHLIDFEDIERDGEGYDTLSRAPSRRQSTAHGVPPSPTREGFDLAAGVVATIDEPQQRTDLVEREAELTASADEGEPLEM